MRPKRRSAMLLLALVAAASGFQSIRSVQSPRSFQLRSQPKPQKDEIQAELRRLAEEMAQPADDEALAPPPVDLAFAPFFMRALLPLAYRGLAAAAALGRGPVLDAAFGDVRRGAARRQTLVCGLLGRFLDVASLVERDWGRPARANLRCRSAE